MYFNNQGTGLNPHKLMGNSEQRIDFERSPKNVGDLFFGKFWSTVHTFLVKNCLSLSAPSSIPRKKPNRGEARAHEARLPVLAPPARARRGLRGAHTAAVSRTPAGNSPCSRVSFWACCRTCHLSLLANRCSLVRRGGGGSKEKACDGDAPVFCRVTAQPRCAATV